MLQATATLIARAETICFAHICDRSSVVHDPQFWLEHSRQGTMLDAVRSLRAAGELISISTILEGTFMLEFNVVDSFEGPCEGEQQRLWLPSGIVTFRSPDDLYAPPRIALKTQPGWYHACVQWHVDRESLHYDIPSPEAYPHKEGPDGLITLWRDEETPHT